MKISVCMIVKDEEAQLERALSSIPADFEIIVIDTGSNDHSVQIAEKYGAKVSYFTWTGNFADARNESIAKASGDYVIILDADEQLASDCALRISEFIEGHPEQAGSVIIHNLTEAETNKHRAVRLFPNNKTCRFVGRVHEQLYSDNQPAAFKNSNLVLIHYGYLKENYQAKDKFERYIRLYKEELIVNPDNGYMLYQLGNLYYSNKQYPDAYEALSTCVDLQQFDHFYFPPMLVTLGYTLKELGYSKQAMELLEPLTEMYPAYPDLPFILGLLSIECGDMDKIEYYFRRALDIGETDRYTSAIGRGSFFAAYNLGVFYELSGQIQEAKNCYTFAQIQGHELSAVRLKQL
jgi:glycosyltransferase involved in cell wall biosynthesis